MCINDFYLCFIHFSFYFKLLSLSVFFSIFIHFLISFYFISFSFNISIIFVLTCIMHKPVRLTVDSNSGRSVGRLCCEGLIRGQTLLTSSLGGHVAIWRSRVEFEQTLLQVWYLISVLHKSLQTHNHQRSESTLIIHTATEQRDVMNTHFWRRVPDSRLSSTRVRSEARAFN